MMKFGANVTQTALKGLNLAKAGNYDHVLNLKYTCRALPSCFSSSAKLSRGKTLDYLDIMGCILITARKKGKVPLNSFADEEKKKANP